MAPFRRDVTVSPSTAAPAPVTWCKLCYVNFATTAYEKHLLNSANHFPCYICIIGHHTQDALKRHMVQMHAAEQNLTCPGCRTNFNRLGGLMSHMEYKECPYLKPDFVEDLRTNDPHNSGKFEAIRSAISWGPIATGNLQLGPNDSAVDVSTRSLVFSEEVEPSEDGFLRNFVREKAAAEEEDLIRFGGPSLVLNASWDQPATNFTEADFPALAPTVNNGGKVSKEINNSAKLGSSGSPKAPTLLNSSPIQGRTAIYPNATASSMHKSISTTATSMNGSAVNRPKEISVSPTSPARPAWDTAFSRTPASTTLFPNAPPAVAPVTVAPLILQMNNLALTPAETYGEHDPDHPNFDAKRYFNDFSQSYKCPHPRCKKSLLSLVAFLQHLRSPAHMKLEKVKCPQCLRQFTSATALTQHIESQTIRCDARNLAHTNTIVEDITQVATTGGYHNDETVKYVNRPEFVNNPGATVSGVIEASRRAIQAQEKFKENYWKERENTKW